jgi:hypothetical protein
LMSRILGSVLSTMLMPCLRYGIAVIFDKSPMMFSSLAVKP